MRIGSAALLFALSAILAAPVLARDVLGIFGRWGAFRDAGEPRCFATAEPLGARDAKRGWLPFASVGFWPRKGVRGQVNIRLSQQLQKGAVATLNIGGKRFVLTGSGADVWTRDRRDDAALVAALRTGGDMTVHGRAQNGTAFSDRYALRGAATAIDAAALGCARR
ncbi:MAG: hypothetical protein J7498_07360 [Sphingobium sp.]|nr:hypothetical protein [Sphingobium sp.]